MRPLRIQYLKNKKILKKSAQTKKELEISLRVSQELLQILQEVLSSVRKYASPSSTTVERASFLKDNVITQLINKLEVTKYNLGYQLLDISQWKRDIDDWLQTLSKTLSSVNDFLRLNSDDTVMPSKLVYFFITFIN